MEKEVEQLIRYKSILISQKFPIEANYNSRCSLWQCGLRAGLVSNELYILAEKYYGQLWTYVGD